MRYISLLTLALLSSNSYAQTLSKFHRDERKQHRREKLHEWITEENDKQRRHDSLKMSRPSSHNKPYVDLLITGGLMVPRLSEHYSYTKIKVDPTIGAIVSGGIDLMFNSKKKHVFMSFGQRIGYSSMEVTTSESARSGNIYTARGIHTGLDVGVNYNSDAKGSLSIAVSGHLQAGFKISNYGLGIEPYVMPHLKLGLRINHTLGINIGAFFQPIDAWKGNPLHDPNAGLGFNVYGVDAELRLSLGGNK